LLGKPHLSNLSLVLAQPTLRALGLHRGGRSPPIKRLGQSASVHDQLGSGLTDLQIQGGQDVTPQLAVGILTIHLLWAVHLAG